MYWSLKAGFEITSQHFPTNFKSILRGVHWIIVVFINGQFFQRVFEHSYNTLPKACRFNAL